jgi:hypothetical protein
MMMADIERLAYTYKLVCKDPSITDCYVGSTTNLRNRKWEHKKCCTNPNSKKYHYKVYQFIRDTGGWDNWQMVMIESFPFINRDDQRKHERAAFDELGATLNMIYPERSVKEYYEANREQVVAKHKEYYEANREQIAAKHKEYREANREQIAAKHKEYSVANRERIAAKQKEHYEANREATLARFAERIQCECGSTISRNHAVRHRRTKKHKDLMATQTPPTES